MKGYTYILLCADGSYYTGSKNILKKDWFNIKMAREPTIQRKGCP